MRLRPALSQAEVDLLEALLKIKAVPCVGTIARSGGGYAGDFNRGGRVFRRLNALDAVWMYRHYV